MPLRVQCPGCDKKMDVPDHVRGKSIRCGGCATTFKIDNSVILAKRSTPADDEVDEKPKPKKKKTGDVRSALDSMSSTRKKKSRDDDDDDYEDEESSGPNKGVLIGGGIAALLVVAGGLIFLLMGKKEPPVAFNPPVNQPNAIQPINPFPNPMVNPNPNPMPNNGGGVNPFQPVGPNNGGGENPFQPVEPNNGGGNPFQPVPPNPAVPNPARPFQDPAVTAELQANEDTPWTAKPDPLTTPIAIPEGAAFAINFPQSTDGILFPSSPSAFFALGNNTNDKSGRLLYNLTTMPKNTKTLVKHVGLLKGRLEGINDDTARLSADGKYIVAKTGQNSFEVWSMGDSSSVFKKEMPEKGSIDWIDFGPTSDQVIVYHGTFASDDRYGLQVWDIGQDKMLHRIPMPKASIDKDAFALSPERRYIAFCTRALGYIADLSTGKMAGVLKFPEVSEEELKSAASKKTKPIGMAFSPDGKQVAALLTDDPGINIIVCEWSMATGKLLADHNLSDYLGRAQLGFRTYNAPQIDYLPDSQAWLLKGTLIVDRESGLVLTKLDAEARDAPTKQRKILPGNLIAQKAKGRSGDGFVSNKFDQAAYETAVKAARGDLGPKLETKDADLTKAKTISVNRGVKFDAAPDIATVKGILGPVPVTSKGNISSIYFSKPSVANALVISIQELTTPFVRKVARADRYDLVSKRSLGGFDVPGIVKLANQGMVPTIIADISPDGTTSAVVHSREANRIDLFGAEGKHVFGFVPHKGDDSKILWLGFASDKLLITLSNNGKIVAWDTATAQASYAIEGNYTGPITMSANRKYMAVFAGTEIEIFDAQSGQVKGIVATGVVAPTTNAAIAFRSETGLLAASIPAGNGKANIVTWDAAGQPTASFSVFSTNVDTLQWCGDAFLLSGTSNLIDLESKALVWNYTSPGVMGSAPLPDSRVWLVGEAGSAIAGRLGGVRMPDTRLGQNLQLAKTPNVEKLLHPGGMISVRVDTNKDATLADRLSQQITAAGYKVGPNAPVTLVVAGTESPSGESMELSSFGGGPGGKRVIPIPKIDATMTLTDKSGQVLWTSKNTVKSFSLFRIFRGNEDPAVVVTNETWGLFASWALSTRLPSSIYRSNGQLLTLPGTSPIVIE